MAMDDQSADRWLEQVRAARERSRAWGAGKSTDAVLVGEMNPYGADPEFALYPLPEHATGGRLALILGLSHAEYLQAFRRVNLVRGRWSAPGARAAAGDLCQRMGKPSPPVILLGSKVCAAFSLAYEPFRWYGWPGARYCVLPHPSGRCRTWNDAGAVHAARRAVRGLLSGEDLGSCPGAICSCEAIAAGN